LNVFECISFSKHLQTLFYSATPPVLPVLHCMCTVLFGGCRIM
jgi:hypothetical protein